MQVSHLKMAYLGPKTLPVMCIFKSYITATLHNPEKDNHVNQRLKCTQFNGYFRHLFLT